MSFLVASSFWWYLGLIFGGLVIAGASVAGIPFALLAGICFFLCGVIGVINTLGGARTTNP